MADFSARLFGPQLPGCGVAVTGAWQDDESLQVIGSEVVLTARVFSITASGFNAERLKISWRDEDREYALIIDGDGERHLCQLGAPPLYSQQILSAGEDQRRVVRRFHLGGAVLAGILLLPLLLLCLAYLNRDHLAEWLVQRIPVQQEARLGDALLAQSRLRMQLIESGTAVEGLRRIGEKLTVGSPHHYRWFVANQQEINAFAAPGGVVVVNAGLLRVVTSADELAGVLAHEIAHAELRHSLKAVVKTLGFRTLLSLTLGDYGGSVFADGLSGLAELRFSREAESEADVEGLRRLVTARINPQGMVSFFATLEREQQRVPPEILSTHPATSERMAALQREIALVTADWDELEVDLEEVRQGLPQQ